MDTERLPPQNIEAEQSVLGSLLIDPDAVIRVMIFLRPEDFYRETHQQIYTAITNLHERREPADFITLCDELERREALASVGGPAYITSLINCVPTSIHVEHYAHIVERTALMRRLIQAAGQIAGLAYEGADQADEVIDRAEQILFGISQRRLSHSLRPIREVLDKYYDRIEYLHQHQGEVVGLPTGFIDLDRLLGGLEKSDLVIVAGRPGMGKTSLALSIAQNASLRLGAVVALFSLEMSGEQLVQRLVAAETGIDSRRLRVGDLRGVEWDQFVKTTGVLADTLLFIDDTPSPSPMEIRTKSRRLAAEYKLDLIIIDYLQLMQGGSGRRSENRVQEISYISRALKGLARELEVPVMALSQLSRAVEQRQDKHPVLADLRESGAIEQDADIVMFIYRDEVYNESTERPNIAEIQVSKHRNGPTGKVELFFDRKLTRFLDLDVYSGDEGYET